MKVPGFTAEAAIPRTTVHWRAEGAATTAAGDPRITPQFCFTPPGAAYTTCCYCDYGVCFCNTFHHRVLPM